MVPELDAIPHAVQREATFALTLGAGLFGATAGTLVFGPGLTPFALLVILGVVGWLASDPAGSPVRLALWSAFASVLALGPARGVDLAGGIAAIPFMGPATLLFVALALSLFAGLRPLASAGSHEDAALARLAAARWLLVVAALASLAAALLADVALGAASLLVLLLAAARWVLGQDDFTSLRRWLERARAEDSPRWRVVDASALDPAITAGLRPLVRAEPLDGVLVRGAPSGPYRGDGTPIALVPRTRSHDRPVRWSLPWRDVGYALGGVIAVGAPPTCVALGLWIVVVLTPAEATGGGPDLGFLGVGAVLAVAAIAFASALATDRRRTVWLLGLVAFGLTALAVSILHGW